MLYCISHIVFTTAPDLVWTKYPLICMFHMDDPLHSLHGQKYADNPLESIRFCGNTGEGTWQCPCTQCQVNAWRKELDWHGDLTSTPLNTSVIIFLLSQTLLSHISSWPYRCSCDWNLMLRHPRRVEAVIAALRLIALEKDITYGCNTRVSTYLDQVPTYYVQCRFASLTKRIIQGAVDGFVCSQWHSMIATLDPHQHHCCSLFAGWKGCEKLPAGWLHRGPFLCCHPPLPHGFPSFLFVGLDWFAR